LQASVLFCALLRKSFRRYVALNLYMAASFLCNAPRLWAVSNYGSSSPEYTYVYYYSDAILTICLYFALLQLYSHVFDEMKAERYLRFGASLLLAMTALFSYLVVHQAGHKLTINRFVLEMSQNLYFIGMVLTYVLWGAVFKLRESRTQLIQLILSLGIYFSANAANYALQNLSQNFYVFLMYASPLIGLWLPAAWTYTFLRVPEDARLVPGRLAVSGR
jgi:hypothetical protein